MRLSELQEILSELPSNAEVLVRYPQADDIDRLEKIHEIVLHTPRYRTTMTDKEMMFGVVELRVQEKIHPNS